MLMSDFKFWGWNKKPRTMLRYVKPGDIFCFQLNNETYGFGRIISKIMTGHVVEIFDFVSSSPSITEDDIKKSNRKITPVVIDTYGLFDRKGYPNSDWRIIGHQNNYTPMNMDDIYFSYGVENSCYKVDIFNNDFPITEKEATKYPRLIPHSDYHIKELLGAI